MVRIRPRTKLKLARKARRCPKCGFKMNNQEIRCKRCSNEVALVGSTGKGHFVKAYRRRKKVKAE